MNEDYHLGPKAFFITACRLSCAMLIFILFSLFVTGTYSSPRMQGFGPTPPPPDYQNNYPPLPPPPLPPPRDDHEGVYYPPPWGDPPPPPSRGHYRRGYYEGPADHWNGYNRGHRGMRGQPHPPSPRGRGHPSPRGFSRGPLGRGRGRGGAAISRGQGRGSYSATPWTQTNESTRCEKNITASQNGMSHVSTPPVEPSQETSKQSSATPETPGLQQQQQKQQQQPGFDSLAQQATVKPGPGKWQQGSTSVDRVDNVKGMYRTRTSCVEPEAMSCCHFCLIAITCKVLICYILFSPAPSYFLSNISFFLMSVIFISTWDRKVTKEKL